MPEVHPKLLLIGGNEFSIFGNTHSTNSSLLFVLHARMSYKEKVYPFCTKLIQRIPNLLCVTFDCANHGTRKIDEKRNRAWDEGNLDTHAMDMFSQMVGALDSVRTALDFFPSYGIKYKNASICGISQGGHAALLCFANEPRLVSCASFISSADYLELLRYRFQNAKVKIEWKNVFPQELEILVKKLNPMNNLEKIMGRPLLMMNGTGDLLVPDRFNIEFERKLKSLPSSNSNKTSNGENQSQLKLYKDVKHEVTSEMEQDCINFFERILTLPASKL